MVCGLNDTCLAFMGWDVERTVIREDRAERDLLEAVGQCYFIDLKLSGYLCYWDLLKRVWLQYFSILDMSKPVDGYAYFNPARLNDYLCGAG